MVSRIRASVRNALELARFGRIGDEYGAPFDVVDRGEHHRLRRYATGAPRGAPPLLLVPPLMVTAEVYDIAPDVSAVAALGARGVEPWVVDFGAPELEEGGMRRSLDDHVRAVVRCVERVRELARRDVHLAGYSQGGMFSYQAAAYLRSEGVASIVTFGSPVDIHRGLPAVRRDVAGVLVRSIAPALRAALERVEGLPGKVTSTGFKLLSTRKELRQRIDFVRMLHDRERLARQHARRKFLGGGGFVAWPGPAFRVFVDEFIVHNRMLSGGFVVDGRALSLADLTCPILAFIGRSDEIARPATVRAIADAAPDAEVRFVDVPAGHFGIVVGSRAMELTWPVVADWVKYVEREGELPDVLRPRRHAGRDIDDDLEPADLEMELDLFVDLAGRAARSAWRRLGDAVASASDTADAVRYQEPRLRRLAGIEPTTIVSPAYELGRRAKKTPDATFFMHKGRAFSFAQADARVADVARGLFARGVRPGERVAIVMGTRPSFLSAATALSRLGAVSVVAPPDAARGALGASLERLGVRRVIVDPERAEDGLRVGAMEVLVLGGGPSRAVPRGAIDMEAMDVSAVVVDVPVDAGRARDLAFVLLRPSESGELREVPVTNHRWALSAMGAAAACTIKPTDTVYCAVPLHHPTGILVSVGAAIAGGARLALGGAFESRSFFADVRRTGATVVFYAGEMLRPLVNAPASPADRTLPIRLVAGSGMRGDLAGRLRERFGFGTMEFYAGTAHRAILADPSGDKPGALGRALPGSADIALVRADLTARAHVRDASGRLALAATGEAALLAVRLTHDELVAIGDPERVVRSAFTEDDAWMITSDVLRRDEDGDHWFVDALSGFVPTDRGAVSTRAVESALYALPEIALAAAWGDGGRVQAAFVAGAHVSAERLTEALEVLAPHERPALVARLRAIPLTEGFRPQKASLVALAAEAEESFELDAVGYVTPSRRRARRTPPG